MKRLPAILFIGLNIFFFSSVSLRAGEEVLRKEKNPAYIKIQKFTLRQQREYVVDTQDPDGVLVQLEYGQSLRIKSGLAKGTIEGYLKWISSDPNGYELNVEFEKSQYVWKDTYDTVPDWQRTERQECWLKPFAAHVSMHKGRDIPLQIEITKTSCPKQPIQVQHERVLHLLDDLLLSAIHKKFILSYNYINSTKPGPQVFALEFPDKVLFKGIGEKPFAFNSGAYYQVPPKELRYHFDVQNSQVKGLVLSSLTYLGGGLASFEYHYDAEKETITHANQLIFVSDKKLDDLPCGEIVKLLNNEKPIGNRIFREVRVEDVKE